MKTFLPFHAFLPSVEKIIKPGLGVLGVVVAWLLGQLLASALEVAPTYPIPSISSQTSATPVLTGQLSGLFGYAEVAQQPVQNQQTSTEQVAKTQLNLVLQGVIVNADQAVAIIETSEKTQVVMENDWILPQVRLIKVMADGVLLDNRGVAEKLLLKPADPSLMKSSAALQTPVAISPRLSGSNQQRLTEIGEALKKSPMSIGQFLRFQPINQQGTWVGVKIWSKNDKSLFKQLGFAEGDLVKQVNGKTIDEMSKNPKLWQAFLTMSEFELVIDRQGEQKTIQVNFN